MEDKNHVANVNKNTGSCMKGDSNMVLIFRLNGIKYVRYHTTIALKINIPKTAAIKNTIFTLTSQSKKITPDYDIIVRGLSPETPISALDTCQFNGDQVEFLSSQARWNEFQSLEEIEADVPMSITLTNLVREFINHNAYVPGTFLHLVFSNGSPPKTSSSIPTLQFHTFHEDINKRPKLWIEWS